MAKYGSAFSATDLDRRAPGQSHAAGLRVSKNTFALADDGGTSEALVVARLAAGDVIDEIKIESDQNLSGLTFKAGTAADDDAIKGATTGPAANAAVVFQPLIANGVTPLAAATEVLLTPSGNIPSSGSIRVTVYASRR